MITLKKMLSWKPCYGKEDSTRRWLRAFPSGEATPLQVARTRKLPVEDRLWCLLRDEALPEKLLHRFACDCAARALELYGGALNEDQRDACQYAIDAKLGWLEGVVGDEELDAAWAAARATAWAARAAARAAGDAERKRQLEHLAEMIEDGDA